MTIQEHIFEKLLVGDGCWEWQGSRDVKNGYGCFSIKKNGKLKNWRAHRAMWKWWYGKTPKKMLCHTCDNPPCCRPDHLYEGTMKQNIADSINRGRFTPALMTWEKVAELRAELKKIKRRGSVKHLAKKYGITLRTIKGRAMTCELVHGDMFKSECLALVNTVNCVGVMGARVALEFKRRYTKNFMLYRDACRLKKLRPGKMFITHRLETENDPTRWIINFPTKDHWKDPSRLSWVHDGLGDLVAQMNRLKIASVAIPPLGCGHGKLHWPDVKMAIEAACEPWPWHAKIYGPEV